MSARDGANPIAAAVARPRKTITNAPTAADGITVRSTATRLAKGSSRVSTPRLRPSAPESDPPMAFEQPRPRSCTHDVSNVDVAYSR